MKTILSAFFTATALTVASCGLFHQADSTNANKVKSEDLIAASQTGALPLFFHADDSEKIITPGEFRDSQECIVRGGLPHFFQKAAAKKPLLIGYIGGSITRGDEMYRDQSLQFIQRMFPDVKVEGLNAGVSGTGTDLGACRIHDQLLQYNPDLIFIEFAVNGAFRAGMEGMIRQIWKYNPDIDICLLYTISGAQWKIYADGQIPGNIRGLEQIASYYDIPSIHMAMEASQLAEDGKLLWKGNPQTGRDQIIFSKDGIHPLKAGGDLYAEAIGRAMVKMKNASYSSKARQLPRPLIVDNWEDAKMLDPKKTASFSEGWKPLDPLSSNDFRQFAPWFPYVMTAGNPGASFTFQLKGSMVGIFDVGGPEAGQLSLYVDGKQMKLVRQEHSLAWTAAAGHEGVQVLNRFNKYCNNRYRGQCEFIEIGPGVHTVKFSISSKKADKASILGVGHLDDITHNPEKYNQTVEWLGKILIRGEAVQKH